MVFMELEAEVGESVEHLAVAILGEHADGSQDLGDDVSKLVAAGVDGECDVLDDSGVLQYVMEAWLLRSPHQFPLQICHYLGVEDHAEAADTFQVDVLL